MRRILLSASILCFLLGLCGAVFAAQRTITVKLDPPAQSNLQLKHETLNSRASNDGSSDAAIGRIGVIIASKASIRRLPSSKSRLLSVCPRDTYLAVVSQKGSWYGLLMSDTSTGWIPKSTVHLLNYEVTRQSVQTQNMNPSGNQIVDTALRCLGISYRWGGYSLNGLDCSGFVKAVFANHHISLPRTAREQAQVGVAIGWGELQPGDRLYFCCKGRQIDHAGIYIGNGYFIHSSTSRRGVAIDPIASTRFARFLVAARRSTT